MKNVAYLSIYYFIAASLLTLDADATSVGNGNVAEQGFNYLIGTVIDAPKVASDPPQNKNHSLRYKLYTLRNPDQPCFLEPTQRALQRCRIDPKAKLVLFVAGFLEEFKPGNLFSVMKDKILANGPFNVIILDWSKYNGPPVNLAFASMLQIGPLAAEMLKFITKHVGIKPEDMILTGHSLGAHLVGYIGRNIPNLGRIDSLDPSWQFTELPPTYPEIQPSDAKYVRVMHSSPEITSFGIARPLGHIDFYINGALSQPGCKFGDRFQRTSGDFVTVDSEALKYICPHEIMNTYFIYSMNNTECRFLATRCDSYEDFEAGKCPPNTSVVADMGFYGENVDGLPDKSKFYLRAQKNPPHCLKDGYKP